MNVFSNADMSERLKRENISKGVKNNKYRKLFFLLLILYFKNETLKVKLIFKIKFNVGFHAFS